MGDYSKAWVLLLEYVEKMALSNTSEVSLAALKALQEMIVASSPDSKMSSSDSRSSLSEAKSTAADAKDQKSELRDINWTLCWKAWLNIGNQVKKHFFILKSVFIFNFNSHIKDKSISGTLSKAKKQCVITKNNFFFRNRITSRTRRRSFFTVKFCWPDTSRWKLKLENISV